MECQMPIFKQDYKVLVRCFTFNHSKYIKDALDGFVMQKTDFPFVCAIVDDCSTDGEQEVIKSYLDNEFNMDSAELYETDYANIIVAEHKTNINCSFAVFFLKYNHYSIKKPKTPYLLPLRDICSYEALCEGDDYWNVPFKLQKQFEWLESHESCQMCCSDAHIMTNDGELSWARYNEDTDIPVPDMIIGGGLFVQTCTLFLRRSLMTDYPECCSKCHVGDYPLQLWASLNGNVHYFIEKTGTYRFSMDDKSWTMRNRTSSVDLKIKVARSEVDMLKGLDCYSKYIYHDFFVGRQCLYVYRIALYEQDGLRDENGIKKVLFAFPDIYINFSSSQKIDVFFLLHNMILSFKIKRKINHIFKNVKNRISKI